MRETGRGTPATKGTRATLGATKKAAGRTGGLGRCGAASILGFAPGLAYGMNRYLRVPFGVCFAGVRQVFADMGEIPPYSARIARRWFVSPRPGPDERRHTSAKGRDDDF